MARRTATPVETGGCSAASVSPSSSLSQLASSLAYRAKADSMTSFTVVPFGVSFPTAWFHGVGLFVNLWAGTKPSLSRQRVYFGVWALPFAAGGFESRVKVFNLALPSKHLAAGWPGLPQLKQALSLTSILGFLHSCPVCPFSKQFGHVVSALLLAGRSRSSLLPPSGFFPKNLRRTKAHTSSSLSVPLFTRAASSALKVDSASFEPLSPSAPARK